MSIDLKDIAKAWITSLNPKEKEIIDQAKKQVPVKKSIWTGTFWTK